MEYVPQKSESNYRNTLAMLGFERYLPSPAAANDQDFDTIRELTRDAGPRRTPTFMIVRGKTLVIDETGGAWIHQQVIDLSKQPFNFNVAGKLPDSKENQ